MNESRQANKSKAFPKFSFQRVSSVSLCQDRRVQLVEQSEEFCRCLGILV